MFRLKERTEILPSTPIAFLTARGDIQRRREYIYDNTKLHEAILENDIEKMEKLLMEVKELKNINVVSLMNTPLLLALKQGNTQLAKCIFKAAAELGLLLDINHKDARGLTALDWACMLRNDEIIRMILLLPNFTLSKKSYAVALYNQAVDAGKFERFIQDMRLSNATEIAENRGYPHLFIFLQEPYSDMVYFMRDICVNQGFMQAKDFPEKTGSSHVWFYRCFKLGYQAFCKNRNQIPVNKELLTAMLNQESLDKWKKTITTTSDEANDEFLKTVPLKDETEVTGMVLSNR